MNVLFIIPRLSCGGAERVTAVLASEMAKEDNVYVFLHRRHGGYAISERVNVIDLHLKESHNPCVKILNFFKAIVWISRTKKNNNIDCSISMLETTNFENVLTKGLGKTIISVRSLYSHRNVGALKRIMITLSNRKADYIVALSNGVAEDLVNNYGANKEKLLTIYNPCNIKDISIRCKSNVDDDFLNIRHRFDFLFITAGRMIPEKGQWHLIKAFSEIIYNHPNTCLLIFGEGELFDQLVELIHMCGVENNVFLMGFHENIYPYLFRSDIFVFSSIVEGFGNVLLEAMACSLPIICSDYQVGARELLVIPERYESELLDGYVCGEYGIVVEALDPQNEDSFKKLKLSKAEKALSNAMESMIIDNKMRAHYREKSTERVKDFAVEKIVSEWKNIIVDK